MKTIRKSFQGFTLVETAVALSVLAITLTGAYTLIAKTVKLNWESRDRTEAVTFAQEGVAFGLEETSKACSDITVGKTADRGVAGDTNKYHMVVDIEFGNFGDPATATQEFTPTADPNPQSSNYDFARIVATVTWDAVPNQAPITSSGSFRTYQVKQVVYIGDDIN